MKIICFGDSNTWGYDPRSRAGESYDHPWPALLAEATGWQVDNQGVNGREVPEEPLSMPEDTDLFLVMLGTNDLLQLDTPEAAAERMKAFLSGGEPDRLVLIAPPVMRWGEWVQDQELIDDSRRLARLYEALAGALGVRFLDAGKWNIPLAYDGVHFTEEGHRHFARELGKELMP